MKRITYLPYFLYLLVFVCLTGCIDDDNLIEDATGVPGKSLVIIEQKLQDTLTLGQTITLQPQWQSVSPVSYRWTIAGEEVGKDSVFTFEPADRGDYEISFTLTNEEDEAAVVYNVHTLGGFENGFFIINEGWFGHGTGTVNFYRYDTRAIEDSIFIKANPDKNLLPVSSTLQYGTVYDEKLFLVSKVGGPLVVADAYSLKEKGRIPAQGGNDWRAVAGIDSSTGLLSAGDGLYRLNLDALETESRIEGISGQTGDLLKAGSRVFVLSQREGAVILNTSSLEIEKTVPGVQVGFARTADGKVWMAGGTSLIGIDPETLETEEVDLGFEVYGAWGAWHPGSIAAGDSEVYMTRNNMFSGGNEIYRYTGNEASLTLPFITLPGERVTYGAGIAYDQHRGTLVVNTVNKGYGDNFSKNVLFIYDGQNGDILENKAYEGYYFPSVSVFHE